MIWTTIGLWNVGLLTAQNGGQSLDKSGYWGSIAAGAFVLSNAFKLQPPYSIVLGAFFGLLFGLAIGAP